MELLVIFAIILIIFGGPILILIDIFLKIDINIISELNGITLLIIALIVAVSIAILYFCIYVAELSVDVCSGWGYLLIVLYVLSTIYSTLLSANNVIFNDNIEWVIFAMPVISILLSATLLSIINKYYFDDFINFLIMIIPVTFPSIVAIIVSLLNNEPINIITIIKNAI